MIDFHGNPVDAPEVRAAFIGCGSHSFRNIYPVFQFTPIRLTAVCDRNPAKAGAFARQFGAERAFQDHRAMLDAGGFEAVFIVVGYDERGRPLYPDLTVECLERGCHVWIEKPPAAACADIERMQAAAAGANRRVMVGMKKMFFPANEKARSILAQPAFGRAQLAALQYPLPVPECADFERYYRKGLKTPAMIKFVDHLVHPASLLLYLMGMPQSLYYERSAAGAALATFRMPANAVATIAFTAGSCWRGGMERTMVVGENENHLVVENNVRVTWFKGPIPLPYGAAPDFYAGGPEDTPAVWEPEWSMGQLYNKALFLLGYWGEVNEFARCIIEDRPPAKGDLRDAWRVTRILEAFAGGPGKIIPIGKQT